MMSQAAIPLGRSHRAARARLEGVAEFGALAALALVAHAVVLRFVFPGHFHPFWPFHSDFYIAPELAHTPTMPGAIAGLPRPVGYLFLYLAGFFGARGAIVCDLLLVAANCAGTAMCLRRFTGGERNGAFFAAAFVYLFLIFAHPAQYAEALYDAFSQVSYGLVLVGLALGWARAPITLQFGAFALGFLAKESYFPAAALFLATCFLTDAKPGRRRILMTAIALGAGLAAALLYSKLVRSEYMGFGSSASSPYHVDLSLASVAREWWAYAGEAGPLLWVYAGLVLLAAILSLPADGRRAAAPALILPLAGLTAWLPNSLLPNHHMVGYSWLGAALIFAPILILPRLWRPGRKAAFAALLVLGLAIPATLKASYAQNTWLLEQQRRQTQLLVGLKTRFAQLSPASRRVLVTGLGFPFSPFDHPRSLYQFARTLPTFSVVIYEPKTFTLVQKPSPARWITPEQASRETFDEVWMFGDDGAPVRWTLAPADAAALKGLGLDPSTLSLYPAVSVALGLGDAKSGGVLNLDGYHLLSCGNAYLSYHRYDAALICFGASKAKIADNPYPYFFSGLAEENLGRPAAARAEFLHAIALDDKAHPNPAFKAELDKVAGAGSPPSP